MQNNSILLFLLFYLCLSNINSGESEKKKEPLKVSVNGEIVEVGGQRFVKSKNEQGVWTATPYVDAPKIITIVRKESPVVLTPG